MTPAETSGSAERMKFFTDAVVAIAMTLLILPLLESVADAARNHLDTAGYLRDHRNQLFAFVLSFVIIGRFWVSHERLFGHVERWTGPLMLLNQTWMLTVVFLPVATALVGSLKSDATQMLVYIGTMLLSSVLMCGMHLLVRRTPQIWMDTGPPPLDRLIGASVLAAMLAVALLVAVALPQVGYLALLLLLLSGPVQTVLHRRLAA